MSIFQIMRTQQQLSEYFDDDREGRFSYVRLHGNGSTALTWTVLYRPATRPAPGTPNRLLLPRYLILKLGRLPPTGLRSLSVDSQSTDSMSMSDIRELSAGYEDTIPNEKKWLRALAWASHIAKRAEVPRDPLRRAVDDLNDRSWPRWIYLEFLENGTLFDFIRRAKQTQRSLPNRLLWSLFLCLIRMCVAMAWPPIAPGDWEHFSSVLEEPRDIAARSILHNDFHNRNVMFGALEDPSTAPPEHMLAPPLKLIDFGNALDLADPEDRAKYVQRNPDVVPEDYDEMQFLPVERNPAQTAIAQNLYEVGTIMLELATLDETARRSVRRGQPTTRFIPSVGAASVETAATAILERDPAVPQRRFRQPQLDDDLRTLIGMCLAVDAGRRPDLAWLARAVEVEARRRDWRYYVGDDAMELDPGAALAGGVGQWRESDDGIRQVIQETLFDAPTEEEL
ncbi:hypothetical protein GGR52DRAFT_585743 [Hypoxylon sp. FL1284]|nr:hypothetical protein GGR52DRAFT_585743 [Hypoxylon sp. FL1284]